MQNKKKQILDAAIRCFARKGYDATSIQEIADELGMAKGSLYFYFKSKDDLLVSVIDYYGEMMFVMMRELPSEAGLPPREKLALQLERQYRFIREHLDFMKMMMREPQTGIHPHIREMMLRLHARSKLWYLNHVLSIYGEEAEFCSADAAALLSGIGSQYFQAMMFENQAFDEWRLSRFLVKRFDDMMTAMLREGGGAILPPPDLAKLRELAGLPQSEGTEELQLLQEIADELATTGSEREAELQADLQAALTLLKEEAEKPVGKHRVLVRAMIAFVRSHANAEAGEKLQRLEKRIVG